jgi:uncharacterized protein
MKYLLILLIVLAIVWLSRGNRRVRPPASREPAAPERQTMLACAQCGLHLPRDETLPGRGGVFCSEAHRAEYERAHPAP